LTRIGRREKVLVMRVLLSVLILILNLHSLTKAEDITDFEIEGIGIYESLLKYMSELEIKSDEDFLFENKKFASTMLKKNSNSNFNLKIYDAVTISYKPNDKNYKIYSIEASISYKNNIEDCYKKKKNNRR